MKELASSASFSHITGPSIHAGGGSAVIDVFLTVSTTPPCLTRAGVVTYFILKVYTRTLSSVISIVLCTHTLQLTLHCPLIQGLLAHSSTSVSQLRPMYPVWQVQE